MVKGCVLLLFNLISSFPPIYQPISELDITWKAFLKRVTTRVANPHCISAFLFVCLFVFFCHFRTSFAAYGSSQNRGRIGAYSFCPMPQPQQRRIQAASATYTTAHGNAGFLTH